MWVGRSSPPVVGQLNDLFFISLIDILNAAFAHFADLNFIYSEKLAGAVLTTILSSLIGL